jgi:hypothetical protein
MIPNIRFLGTYLFWNNMYNGNGWILAPEAIFGMEKPLGISHDSGSETIVLRWECRLNEIKREFRAFVHPDKEWSVSKIELVDLIDGQERPVIVSSVRNKKWETGNVIFPDMIITDHYDKGVRFRSETVTVTNARFNITIDPSTFTLEGMDLPDGSITYDETVEPENQVRQWSTRDGKAVPWTGPPPEEVELPQVSRGNIIFRVVGFVIGLLMLLYALRIMWKNKHDS